MGHSSGRRPGHGHEEHDHATEFRHIRRELNDIQKTLAILRASAGRTEGSVGASQGGVEELLNEMSELQTQLEGIGGKLDTVTTGFAGVIDSAVARILAEIAKQGAVSPEVQAAAAHLSTVADNLIALNGTSLERIASAGVPVVIPPAPEPIPEPAPPVVVDPDPSVPMESRRRR